MALHAVGRHVRLLNRVHDVAGLCGERVHRVDVLVRLGDGVLGDPGAGQVVVLAVDALAEVVLRDGSSGKSW